MQNRVFGDARQMKWSANHRQGVRSALIGILFILSMGFVQGAPLDDAHMITKIRINSYTDKASRITRKVLLLFVSDDNISYQRYTDDNFTCVIEANKIVIENLKITKPFLKIAFTREWSPDFSMAVNKNIGVRVFKNGKWKMTECGVQTRGKPESEGADFKAPNFAWDYGTRALVVNTQPVLDFPGKKTIWRGYTRHDFVFDQRKCLVVEPKTIASGKPWIWRARFFNYRPEIEMALLSKGYHLVYMDVEGLFGSPKAVSHWNAFYRYLTEDYGFARKPVLEGISRGGLMIYNWAIANPEKVSCIIADAAVCDFKSWPAGKGKGLGNATEWANLLKAYELTETEALAYKYNPIDNLEPLAKAKVPLLHVHGKADKVVPVEENALILEQRYKKLGGEITVIIQEETPFHVGSVRGHIAGLEDVTPIVEFILKNAEK